MPGNNCFTFGCPRLIGKDGGSLCDECYDEWMIYYLKYKIIGIPSLEIDLNRFKNRRVIESIEAWK